MPEELVWKEEFRVRAIEITPEPERYLEPAEEWMIPETSEPFIVLEADEGLHEIYLEELGKLDVELARARITRTEDGRIRIIPEKPLTCKVEYWVDYKNRKSWKNIYCRLR